MPFKDGVAYRVSITVSVGFTLEDVLPLLNSTLSPASLATPSPLPTILPTASPTGLTAPARRLMLQHSQPAVSVRGILAEEEPASSVLDGMDAHYQNYDVTGRIGTYATENNLDTSAISDITPGEVVVSDYSKVSTTTPAPTVRPSVAPTGKEIILAFFLRHYVVL